MMLLKVLTLAIVGIVVILRSVVPAQAAAVGTTPPSSNPDFPTYRHVDILNFVSIMTIWVSDHRDSAPALKILDILA
jgi:uncharacterized membrane protein